MVDLLCWACVRNRIPRRSEAKRKSSTQTSRQAKKAANKQKEDDYWAKLDKEMDAEDGKDTFLTEESPSRKSIRQEANIAAVKQAVRMVDARNHRTKEVKVGDVVMLKVPKVDHWKGDPPNLPCIVLELVRMDTYCRLGVKSGALDTTYPRNNLVPVQVSPSMYGLEKVLAEWIAADKPKGTVSAREAVKDISVIGGQGVCRCDCRTTCSDKKCLCKKSGVPCNSRCHTKNLNNNCCNKQGGSTSSSTYISTSVDI